MNKPTYIQEALERIRCKYPRGLKRGHPCDIQILENTITSELQGLGERIEKDVCNLQDNPSGAFAFIDGYDKALGDVLNLIRSLTSPDLSDTK